MLKDNSTRSRDIDKAYKNKKYIVTRFAIYQPHFSVNAGYYASKIYSTKKPLCGVGRFLHLSGDDVNCLIDIKLVDNL